SSLFLDFSCHHGGGQAQKLSVFVCGRLKSLCLRSVKGCVESRLDYDRALFQRALPMTGYLTVKDNHLIENRWLPGQRSSSARHVEHVLTFAVTHNVLVVCLQQMDRRRC